MIRALILTFPVLLSGCASVTPVAAVIGAGASVANAYYSISDKKGYVLVSKECLWYRKVKLSEEGKKGLTRDDKEQVAANNINYQNLCPVE